MPYTICVSLITTHEIISTPLGLKLVTLITCDSATKKKNKNSRRRAIGSVASTLGCWGRCYYGNFVGLCGTRSEEDLLKYYMNQLRKSSWDVIICRKFSRISPRILEETTGILLLGTICAAWELEVWGEIVQEFQISFENWRFMRFTREPLYTAGMLDKNSAHL